MPVPRSPWSLLLLLWASPDRLEWRRPAMAAYSEIEGEMCDRDDVDIVLVGADSLDAAQADPLQLFRY